MHNNKVLVEEGDTIYIRKNSRIEAFTELLKIASYKDHERMIRIISAVYDVYSQFPQNSYKCFQSLFTQWKSILLVVATSFELIDLDLMQQSPEALQLVKEANQELQSVGSWIEVLIQAKLELGIV